MGNDKHNFLDASRRSPTGHGLADPHGRFTKTLGLESVREQARILKRTQLELQAFVKLRVTI